MAKNRTPKRNKPKALTVLGYEDAEERGLFTRRIARSAIDVEKLGDEVADFMDAMEEILGRLAKEVGNYHLDSIDVTAEVSAKGTVSLLGTGGEVEGRGGLTFTFKRADAKSAS